MYVHDLRPSYMFIAKCFFYIIPKRNLNIFQISFHVTYTHSYNIIYQTKGEISLKKTKLKRRLYCSLLPDKFLRLKLEMHTILLFIVLIIFIVYKGNRFSKLSMREKCSVPLDKLMISTSNEWLLSWRSSLKVIS